MRYGRSLEARRHRRRPPAKCASARAHQLLMVSNMPAIFNILIPVALFAVFATLCFGVYAMFRGGDFGRSWSNRMMRLRVVVQFLAVIIIMSALFFVEQLKGR